MDGLKQIEVVSHSATQRDILGLRGDGVLFRGLVTVDHDGKATVEWTLVVESKK